MSDRADKIAFLSQFKADIQALFEGDDSDTIRSRINRGMRRAREIVGDTGALQSVTLTPPPAFGGLIIKDADPFNFILQDYYGASMVPAVADMIEQSIGFLESPDYAQKKETEPATRADTTKVVMPKNDGPELPSKVTIAWLVRHVPVSFWLWFGGAIVAAFAAGLKFAKSLR